MQQPTQRSRTSPLSRLISTTQDAITARSQPGTESRLVSDRIFEALESMDCETRGCETDQSEREILATCGHLESALDDAKAGPPPVAAVAEAFAATAPLVSWYRRPGAAEHGAAFYDGHANTMLIGPKGLEQRSDVVIGASLLAPDVEYPHHSHPPEELYVVLNAGEWYSDRAGWYTPGVGDIIHHSPGITHAMRSGAAPLLAIWCLWVG